MKIMTKGQYEEYYSNLQGQACDLTYKIRGLAYLFSNFQPEMHGSPMEERENMMGIGCSWSTLKKMQWIYTESLILLKDLL